VTYTLAGVANVDGAGVAVVDRWRWARNASPVAVAHLCAVARVPITAICAGRQGAVQHALNGVAAIRCTPVSVVNLQWRSRRAHTVPALLVAIAHIVVTAGRAICYRGGTFSRVRVAGPTRGASDVEAAFGCAGCIATISGQQIAIVAALSGLSHAIAADLLATFF
jgi:hypothetical protein